MCYNAVSKQNRATNQMTCRRVDARPICLAHDGIEAFTADRLRQLLFIKCL